jgi:hypothetical protein
MVLLPFNTEGSIPSLEPIYGSPHSSYNVTISIVGNGSANVTTVVWKYVETVKTGGGVYEWETVPLNNAVITAGNTTVYVAQGHSINILAISNNSTIFYAFSGKFVNSTNYNVTFTPNSSGVERIIFVTETSISGVGGQQMLWDLYYIVLAIGTFVIVAVGFVVSADFWVGTDKDKAWERLKAWLIGAMLFYAGVTIAPIVMTMVV